MVVGVGGEHAAGVGRGQHVASGIERARGRAGVRRDERHRVVQAVVAVGRDEVARVGHGGEVVRIIVGVLRQRTAGLRDGEEPVERVVGVRGRVRERVGRGQAVAVATKLALLDWSIVPRFADQLATNHPANYNQNRA